MMKKIINKSGQFNHKDLLVSSIKIASLIEPGTIFDTVNGQFTVLDCTFERLHNVVFPVYKVKQNEIILENVKQSYLLKFVDIRKLKPGKLVDITLSIDTVEIGFTVSLANDKTYIYSLSPTSESGFKFVKFKDELGQDCVSFIESAVLRLSLEILGPKLNEAFTQGNDIQKNKYTSCKNCKACRTLSTSDITIGDASNPDSSSKSTFDFMKSGQYYDQLICGYIMRSPGADRIESLNQESLQIGEASGYYTAYEQHYTSEALDCSKYHSNDMKRVRNNTHDVIRSENTITVTTCGYNIVLQLKPKEETRADRFESDEYRVDSEVSEEVLKLREKKRRVQLLSNKEQNTLQYKEGDILDATEGIIVHQVNCRGVMGSGLAKQIADKYPIVLKEYQHLCSRNVDNISNILGCVLFSSIESDNKFIANLFGQDRYGKDKQYTDYKALRSGLLYIAERSKETGMTIAIPYKLGCGLAGGDWNIVEKMIREILPKAVIYRMGDM